MKVWISRNDDCDGAGYDLWREKPKYDKFYHKYKGLPFMRISVDIFVMFWPDLALKRGKCQAAEMSVNEGQMSLLETQ